jgi:hypothetical protein
MGSVQLHPNLRLASHFVVYGSLGTASSAIVYLLHDQIQQINRMSRLFDGSGRRRISELAKKHGVCESTARRFLEAQNNGFAVKPGWSRPVALEVDTTSGVEDDNQVYFIAPLRPEDLSKTKWSTKAASLGSSPRPLIPHHLRVSFSQKPLVNTPRRRIQIAVPSGARSISSDVRKMSNVISPPETLSKPVDLGHSSNIGEEAQKIVQSRAPESMRLVFEMMRDCEDEVTFNNIFKGLMENNPGIFESLSNQDDIEAIPENHAALASNWLNLAISKQFFESVNIIFGAFAPLVDHPTQVAYMQSIMRAYSANAIDNARFDSLLALIYSTPPQVTEATKDDFMAILKVPLQLPLRQRSTLAMAITSLFHEPSSDFQLRISESLAHELLQQWYLTESYDSAKTLVMKCLQGFKSKKSKESFLMACMAVCSREGEVGLAGRIAVIMLENIPDIRSNWQQLIPILTTVAAAGLVNVLRVTLDSLHTAKLIPEKAKDRKAFAAIPLSLTCSRNAELKSKDVLDFLEITVHRDNLPVGAMSFYHLTSMITNEPMSLEELKNSFRRLISLSLALPDIDEQNLRQHTMNAAFKGLVMKSPSQGQLHYSYFQKICRFDIGLVTKEMCALVIDSMTKSFNDAQEFVRKAGKSVQGFGWSAQRFRAYNKMRLDLSIHVVQEVATQVQWRPGMSASTIWLLNSQSHEQLTTLSKAEAQNRLVIASMRQAMARKEPHVARDLFQSHIAKQGGVIPKKESLFCLAISASLRSGDISTAISIRDEVEKQHGSAVLAADFILEKHHIAERRMGMSFDEYLPIVDKWNAYDKTEHRKHFYDVIVQIFKKLYHAEDIHTAAQFLHSLYQDEANRSALAKRKLLKTLLVAYSKSLDLQGMIWTVSTAIKDDLEWDADFRHLLRTHSQAFLREYRLRLADLSAAMAENQESIGPLYERSVAVDSLVYATITRLKRLATKTHVRQINEKWKAHNAVLNMLLFDMIKPDTLVKRSTMVSIPDKPNSVDEAQSVENGDSAVVDGTDEMSNLPEVKMLSSIGNQQSSSKDLVQHIGSLKRREYDSFAVQKAQKRERFEKHITSKSTGSLLMDRIKRYAYILGDENEIQPAQLADSMLEEVQDLFREIDNEFGPGPSAFSGDLGQIPEKSNMPPHLIEPRPLPVQRRFISRTMSPWKSHSPVKAGGLEENSRHSGTRKVSLDLNL